MSARKLGRFAGLVFVLAAFVGGVAAASVEHGTAGVKVEQAAVALQGDIVWD